MSDYELTERQEQILEVITTNMRERGFPPSVREIGKAVGLTSPSTVHSHLATLEELANENVEELMPLPADLTGDGELFMLRVRGESMINAGIFDGDFIVARVEKTASNGDIVVAGIPGEEATVKTFKREDHKIVLEPANDALEPMVFNADEVQIFGKVVTVLRRL